MTRRPPSPPPQIAGFTFDRYLGGGGFADVFLYDQHRPRRKVAVKVLLRDKLTPAAQAAFDDEADLMAQLSNHPAIVTIYQVDRAADGRPYLAMQYCPGPSLGQRYRKEPLSVPDALRTGVEIAGAVETAHRTGILHRDIKPHNILFTEYNEPLLTDFGIAATVGDVQASEGMSIPWSPPESFADPPVSGVATDVWGLGATVYTLLAGRSPFEVRGGPNKSADLITRIETGRLTPTGRADVPRSLEQVLSTAMGHRPDQRYPSAIAFARALQRVQAELGLDATVLSVHDATRAEIPGVEEPSDEPGTRIRPIQIIELPGPTFSPSKPDSEMPVISSPPHHHRGVGYLTDSTGPSTSSGATTSGSATSESATLGSVTSTDPAADATTVPVPEPFGVNPSRPNTRLRTLALVAGFVGLTVVVAMVLTHGNQASTREKSPTNNTEPVQDNLAVVVPAPSDVVGTVEGNEVVFHWTNPDPAEGDAYLWRVVSFAATGDLARVEAPEVTVPVQPDRTCIEVFLVRGGKASLEPARGCA